jgi:hypothetical protein
MIEVQERSGARPERAPNGLPNANPFATRPGQPQGQ